MSNLEHPSKQLEEALSVGKGPAISRYILAVLSGVASVAGSALGGGPGNVAGSAAGGAIGGASAAWSEHDQEKVNHILQAWLRLQQDEIEEIGITMVEVMTRLDLTNLQIQARIESPEYLNIIKKCFRDWSAAESEDKRLLIRNLLVNAAGANITSDDVIRSFVNWIDNYSEAHFKVVRAIYNHAGITRLGIWQSMGHTQYREDSAEADLFKLLISDLTTGHIIRQHRRVDYQGNFIPDPSRPRVSGASKTYVSAFDNVKQYELTGLGQQFVHYTMSDLVTGIGA